MHGTAPLSRSGSCRVFSWLAASRRTGKGATVDGTSTIDNGKKQVQTLLLNPITVDDGLVNQVIIRDKFHMREQVSGTGGTR